MSVFSFSGLSVALVFITLLCCVILFLYSRLMARKNRVDLCLNELEALIRRWLDQTADFSKFFLNTAKKNGIPAETDYIKLFVDLNDACNDVEPEDYLTAYMPIQKQLGSYAKYKNILENESLEKLHHVLAETEAEIQIAGQAYNKIVAPYNESLKHFPGNILARLFMIEIERPFKNDGQ